MEFAFVQLKTPEDGGRLKPLTGTKHWLGIVFPSDKRSMHYSAVVDLLDHDELPLGASVLARLTFINHDDTRRFVESKEDFLVMEGTKVIGTGAWSAMPPELTQLHR